MFEDFVGEFVPAEGRWECRKRDSSAKMIFFPGRTVFPKSQSVQWIEGKRTKYCQSTLKVFLQASSHQTGSPITTFPSINLCLRTLFESLSLQRQDEDAESVTAMQKIIFPGEFQKTVLLQNRGKSVKYFCNILNILINSDELFKEFVQISSSFLPVSS